jgi:hypothetical protein
MKNQLVPNLIDSTKRKNPILVDEPVKYLVTDSPFIYGPRYQEKNLNYSCLPEGHEKPSGAYQ